MNTKTFVSAVALFASVSVVALAMSGCGKKPEAARVDQDTRGVTVSTVTEFDGCTLYRVAQDWENDVYVAKCDGKAAGTRYDIEDEDGTIEVPVIPAN